MVTKKSMLLAAVSVFLYSCDSENIENDIVPDVSTDEVTTTSANNNDEEIEGGLGSKNVASLSGCNLTNNVLFDAPVNNNIVPVNRANFGMGSWQLVDELSDEFNYPGGKTAPVFQDKWKLGFVNNYTGPAPTVWTGNQVTFETINGGNRAVVLTARQTGSGNNRKLQCGMMSTRAKSSYPLYQEARVKISNSQLANAVWMLSSDPGTTEEIDNLEAYGPRLRPNGSQCSQPFYADRIHLSHHTFATAPNGNRLDYQPKKDTWMSRKKSNGNCARSNEVVWSEDYHYFGVRWQSPTRLVYYIDGKRVKVVDGLRIQDGIDPLNYTRCGDGMTREMHMLISQAAQTWRYGSGQAGITNFWNSADIKTGNNTKMFVDWIRVYSPTGNLNARPCN